jgi:hypothetical protein
MGWFGLEPITVAARSEEWTVSTRSMGSNPTQGMDVCVRVYSVFVFPCVKVAALQRADPSSKEFYRLFKNDYETEGARAHRRTVELLVNEWKWYGPD